MSSCPSPLLEELPNFLAVEVLPRLDPADLALFVRARRASRAAMLASGLPRAGSSGGVAFKRKQFVGSAERLAWGLVNAHHVERLRAR
jgi:hypothetical protein